MIWDVIKTAMIRARINSIQELAEITGIGHTLQYDRRKKPGSFRWYEIEAIGRVLKFTPDEWEVLRP